MSRFAGWKSPLKSGLGLGPSDGNGPLGCERDDMARASRAAIHQPLWNRVRTRRLNHGAARLSGAHSRDALLRGAVDNCLLAACRVVAVQFAEAADWHCTAVLELPNGPSSAASAHAKTAKT